MDREMEKALSGLVRVGTVTDVDKAGRRARVKFQSEDFTSGWLYVLQHRGAELVIEPDARHSHTITDTYSGGGSASTYPAHQHPGSVLGEWMPEVNDTAVCLYLPVFNGDGYILGVL